jgi:hypothetical protein
LNLYRALQTNSVLGDLRDPGSTHRHRAIIFRPVALLRLGTVAREQAVRVKREMPRGRGSVLAAIHHRSLRGLQRLSCGPAVGVNRRPDIPRARECLADIPVFGAAVERNHSIAMHAVRLKSVADSIGPFAKYLRAFCAFYSDFFIDHENAPKLKNRSLRGKA